VRPDVEVKPDKSFVTALDARIERRMREMLADRFPSHGIIGEEEAPSDGDADLVWVLDPIDGTAAFIAGLPVYGSLIALMRKASRSWGSSTIRSPATAGSASRAAPHA
jgi:fructose-1,6-bisphosphatase/inositol monophosphatase family enzyme